MQRIVKDKDDKDARRARRQRRMVPTCLQKDISLAPFTAYIKRNSRWLRCPNVKVKTKLLLCFSDYFETCLSCTPTTLSLHHSFVSSSLCGFTGPLLPFYLRQFSNLDSAHERKHTLSV